MKRLLIAALTFAAAALAAEPVKTQTFWMPSKFVCDAFRLNHSPAALSCVPALYVLAQSPNSAVGFFKVTVTTTQSDGTSTQATYPMIAFPEQNGPGAVGLINIPDAGGTVTATAVAYVPEQ